MLTLTPLSAIPVPPPQPDQIVKQPERSWPS